MARGRADERLNYTKWNFASGEISPELWSNTNLKKYTQGLRKLLNGFIKRFGGATQRAGTNLVNKYYEWEDRKLVRFKSKNNDSYSLVFGEFTLDIFRHGAFFQKLDTSYSYDELKKIKYEQNIDILTIVSPSDVIYELVFKGEVLKFELRPYHFEKSPAAPEVFQKYGVFNLYHASSRQKFKWDGKEGTIASLEYWTEPVYIPVPNSDHRNEFYSSTSYDDGTEIVVSYKITAITSDGKESESADLSTDLHDIDRK